MVIVGMKKTLLLSALLAVSASSQAVDGYGGIKFGATKEEFLANPPCTMRPYDANLPGMEILTCNDLQVASSYAAHAYFLGDRFLKFAIEVPWASLGPVSTALTKKYGVGSSASSREEVMAVVEKPNSTAYLRFDNDTITLMTSSDANMNKSVAIIYSHPGYDEIYQKIEEDALQGQL